MDRIINDSIGSVHDRNYGYDDRGRLAAATADFLDGSGTTTRYFDYDPYGNLICKGRQGSTCGTDDVSLVHLKEVDRGYPTAASPEGYVPLRPNAPTWLLGDRWAGNSLVPTYDEHGNLTNALPDRTVSHDAVGRLSQIASGSITTNYFYGGTGRRVMAAKSEPALFTREMWVTSDFEHVQTYDGVNVDHYAVVNLALAGRVVARITDPAYTTAVKNPNCQASIPPAWVDGVGPGPWAELLSLFGPCFLAYGLIELSRRTRRWNWGSQGAVATGAAVVIATATIVPVQLLAPKSAAGDPPAGVVFFHGDTLGSTSIVTDGTGQLVTETSYTPFGERILPASAGDMPVFGFTGQRFDEAHEVYDYGARWYDPYLGIFLQPDPLVPNPFDPASLNSYSYVRNDPANRIDPTGHADLGVIQNGIQLSDRALFVGPNSAGTGVWEQVLGREVRGAPNRLQELVSVGDGFAIYRATIGGIDIRYPNGDVTFNFNGESVLVMFGTPPPSPGSSQRGTSGLVDRVANFFSLPPDVEFIPSPGGFGSAVVSAERYGESLDASIVANSSAVVGSVAAAVTAVAAPVVEGSVLANQAMLVGGAASQVFVRRVAAAALAVPVVGPFAVGGVNGYLDERKGIPYQASLSGPQNAGNLTGRFAARAQTALVNSGVPILAAVRERLGIQ